MKNEIERAAKHWDEYAKKYSGRVTGLYWYELSGVLNYINKRISGSADVDWVEYTVRKYFPEGGPVDRCLSLGCGTGQLERNLARLRAFRGCDAYDLSEESVKTARKLAAEAGFDGIDYKMADINRLELPEASYDAAWLYGSLHHFHALEHVVTQLRRSLKPGGLLAFNEYVGPDRFQFPQRQKEVANLCLKLLPLRYRRILDEALELEAGKAPKSPPETVVSRRKAGAARPWSWLKAKWLGTLRQEDAIPPGSQAEPPPGAREAVYREEVGFPSVSDVIEDDPSESVRSAEILQVVRRHFDIVEETAWGGNIPQFLLSGIAGNFGDDECSRSLLEMIWKIDATLVQCGEFKSDFAYVVARPRPK